MDIAGNDDEGSEEFNPIPKKRRGSFKPYDINGPEAEQLVYDFASFGAPITTIATMFGVTRQTIYNRFGDLIKLATAESDMSLRRAIWRLAYSDGHKAQATMLIWLSKNRLGWTDNTASLANKDEETGEVTFTVQVLEAPNANKL